MRFLFAFSSAVRPLFLSPALQGALLPQRVVLVHHGGHKVVGLVQPASGEAHGEAVVLAEVAVMTERVAAGKRPDKSKVKAQYKWCTTVFY